MPRWRRRRFQRLRKNRKDDHTWVFKKIKDDRHHLKFVAPGDPIQGTPDKAFHIKIDYTMVKAFPSKDTESGENPPEKYELVKSFRVCSVCGQESLEGAKPPLTCKEAVTKKVMES